MQPYLATHDLAFESPLYGDADGVEIAFDLACDVAPKFYPT
jgi:hypothetical protein